MKNKTSVNYFVLLGISNNPYAQVFLFLVFLVIYLQTLLGNVMIMLAIRNEPHLQTPMYFFLFHLSFLDLCYSSVTVPNMLQNILTGKKTISLPGCITQMSFILLMGCTEAFMLSAMAYDRYVAVCTPLHYVRIMEKRLCGQLVGGTWLISALFSFVNTVPVLFLHFCGTNKINGLSCELPSLLALSCMETMVSQMVFLISFLLLAFLSFSITLVSYIYIICTILKIQSTAGRLKAFSTCSSHITVVVLYYVTGLFRYFRPGSVSLVALDRLFSIQYSVLTPMLNPIIYSLKNREVKRALRKILGKMKGKHVP
ncbi:olfactory receptor 5A2-like [Alligator mississippiensis]|uniref:olfactory receptor 5A2-like n=1 Tax=Alligator mississippiensis TaxID=8496 RepID=UPI00287741B0|nr:olfactory receptor 5A2-like [Alligator mississippiensis]